MNSSLTPHISSLQRGSRGSSISLLVVFCVWCCTACASAPPNPTEYAAVPDGDIGTLRKAPPGEVIQDPKGNTINDKGEVWPLQTQGTEAITTFTITPSRSLWVGYSNGTFAHVKLADPSTLRSTRLEKNFQSHTIRTFSSDGTWMVLDGKPFTMMNIQTGDVVLQPSNLPGLAGYAFAPAEARWFVADTQSKLHVWERNQLVASQKGEDLRDVMQRATPAFSAGLSNLTKWMLSTSKDSLVYLDAKGTANLLEISQGRIRNLFSLSAQPTSFSANASNIAVTTTDGALRVMDTSKGSFYRWSLQEKAQLAALTSESSARLYTVNDDTLSARNTSTGDILWTRPIPQGALCGLQAHEDNAVLALCINHAIVLLDPNDGKMVGAVTATGTNALWTSTP